MDDDKVEILTEQAADALQQGDPVRALALGDQITAIDPEDPMGRVIRAHALLATGAYDEAFREGQLAALLDPESEECQIALALVAWRKNRLRVAQEAFEKAIDRSGQHPEFMAQYAWFLASERGPRVAKKAAEDAIECDKETATAWAALGLAQYRMHQPDEAESTLMHALHIDPNNPHAQSAMIQILKRRGDHHQAAALADVLHENVQGMPFVVPENTPESPPVEEKEDDEPPAPEKTEVLISPSPKRKGIWMVGTLVVTFGLGGILMTRQPLAGLVAMGLIPLIAIRLYQIFEE